MLDSPNKDIIACISNLRTGRQKEKKIFSILICAGTLLNCMFCVFWFINFCYNTHNIAGGNLRARILFFLMSDFWSFFSHRNPFNTISGSNNFVGFVFAMSSYMVMISLIGVLIFGFICAGLGSYRNIQPFFWLGCVLMVPVLGIVGGIVGLIWNIKKITPDPSLPLAVIK